MTKNTYGEQSPEAGTMQQVRELLFGAQIKEMETRFQRQEEEFARELEEVRAALKARQEAFELAAGSESESIRQSLRRELDERDGALEAERRARSEAVLGLNAHLEALHSGQRAQADALERLAGELAAARDAFGRKAAGLAEALDAAERSLRQTLLAENGALAGKIEEKHQEALKIIADTAAQLRQTALPRSDLAALFNDLACKMSGRTEPAADGRTDEGSGGAGDRRHD